MPTPNRGEVWLVDLNPIRGREQAGRRPALVVSVDEFNNGPADLVAVLPLTTRERGIPFHVEVKPPEGKLDRRSFVMCEQLRCISQARLIHPLGTVSSGALGLVDDRLRILLGL